MFWKNHAQKLGTNFQAIKGLEKTDTTYALECCCGCSLQRDLSCEEISIADVGVYEVCQSCLANAAE